MRLCDQNGTKNIKTYCIPTCGQCLFSLQIIHLHFTTPRNMFCRPSSSPSAASLDRACGGTEGWLIFIYIYMWLPMRVWHMHIVAYHVYDCRFTLCIYVLYKFFTCSSYTLNSMRAKARSASLIMVSFHMTFTSLQDCTNFLVKLFFFGL